MLCQVNPNLALLMNNPQIIARCYEKGDPEEIPDFFLFVSKEIGR